MRVWAWVGQKGGSGKSTAALCVASELAVRGRKVVVLDCDTQGTASTWAAVAAAEGHAAPFVRPFDLRAYERDELHTLGAEQGYDLAVLDAPPRHDELVRMALAVATVAVLPCGPGPADAWALAGTLELVQAARELRGPELRACVLLTRVTRSALSRNARDVLKESGLPVLGTELGYRTAYQEALAAGQGVTTYAPSSPAADEVRALVGELEHFDRTGKTWRARHRE